jgi:hypothetical protein
MLAAAVDPRYPNIALASVDPDRDPLTGIEASF